jgi:hypothetical protein
MSEYPLRGGSVNTVVRAGDTVRRRPADRFVHELLGFFERSGWGGIRLICDAYRLDGRDEIVDVIMWWQDRCWRGIQTAAAAGDPAMVRLRDDGAVREVRAAFGWVAENRAELEGS